MALFARSRQKAAPQPPPVAPPTTARGGSGRGHTQGFLQLEELNAELQGFQGLQVYDRMYRTDPDVRRNAQMVMNPIIQGTWEVEPYGGTAATAEDEQVAQAVDWMLTEFLGKGEGLQGHLGEFLPVLIRSGFCPGEQLWGPAEYEGKTIIACRKIALRLPRSVYRWPQDDDGELVAIEQFLPQKGMVRIEADNLVYYRVGAEGDNWEGVSMLRPVYKPWYLKDKIERLDAIGIEREAVGLPVIFPPSGSAQDASVLDDLEDKVARLRAGAQAYMIMPGPEATASTEGWTFRIEGFGGGAGGKGRDVQPALKGYRDAISAAFIAEFMRLGQSGTGARATGETQQEPFELGVEALAAIPAKQLRPTIIRRFVELNFPNATGLPTLKMSKADAATLEALGSYVSQLMGAGALHFDDPLEDQLRERADLPAADPAARKQRQAQQQQQQDLALKQQQQQQQGLNAPAAPPGGPKPPPPANRTATVEHDGDTFTVTYEPETYNWVEQTGGLPRKIHELMTDLKEKGHDESSAIAIAVEAAKRFCANGKPDWCAAVAEWEDKRARAKAQHSRHPEVGTYARQDRELRGFEQLMSLDHIETSIDEARARFEAAGGEAARTQAAHIAAAVAARKRVPAEPAPELVQALEHELGVLYAVGRQTVADELHRQGAPVTHSTFARGQEPGTVKHRAVLAARAIAARIYQAVTRLHLTGRKSLADLQRAGEQEAAAGLRAEAQLHAAGALNEGRADEAQVRADEIVGARLTSILDGNRCEVCAAADDNVLRKLDDPIRLANRPPLPDCLGGGRCRCMEFYQLRGEISPSA